MNTHIEQRLAIKEDIKRRIASVLPAGRGFTPLHEPTFAGNEKEYLVDCIDTGWVSSVGKYVDRFEDQLAAFTGSKRAVAVANGTAALHICLLLAGVQPNDEVLCPTLTFIATANAISYCHAVPHFVDSDHKTLGIDPGKLKDYLKDTVDIKGGDAFNKNTGRRIKALVVMHAFGHASDNDALLDICNRYRIAYVEDAAESLGSYYKGIHTGNHGIVASLSFNGNKTITTGGGGAILTNNEELGKLAKHITTTAKVPHRWAFNHDMVGYNYRMPNLNAALGCAQLEQLPGLLDSKRKLAHEYRQAFQDMQGICWFEEPVFSKSNYWLNILMLDKEYSSLRDELLDELNDAGIMCRPTWTLMHKLSMYNASPAMDLSGALDIEARLINVPSSPNLV
jgi:perosamine synthetase